jgi:hypothetical protein
MNLRSLKLKYRNMEKNSKVLTKFEKGITELSAVHRTFETKLACDREMPQASTSALTPSSQASVYTGSALLLSRRGMH